jgi:hypothetical protein
MRIGVIALGVITGAAIGTDAACNGGTHHHAIADVEVPYILAKLFHDADAFVTQDRAWLHPRHRPPDEMEVGTTDRRRRQADDRIGRRLQLRLRHIVHSYVTHRVKYHGFHGRLPL